MSINETDTQNTAFFTLASRSCELRQAINTYYLADEQQTVTNLLSLSQVSPEVKETIDQQATKVVELIRDDEHANKGLDAFLLEYDLSTKEGIILMCIAEALLRIPDNETVDKLIRDKLLSGDWDKHVEHSESLLVNASTWGLMLTGKMVSLEEENSDISTWVKRLVAKSGEPVIRTAMRQAMAILGQQFVMGQTIDNALKRSQDSENIAYRYSFDMLGEAAITHSDAEKYFKAYQQAILKIAESSKTQELINNKPSISIKLSALHPRYHLSQHQRVHTELRQQLYDLALLAKENEICLTIDAEETERLELSLDLFESIFTDPSFTDWNGLGLAVQAYQKRAYSVLEWLIQLAKTQNKRIPVRLVKGAYWDSEIKRAQELGLANYPVFTRKHHSDLSYQVCAKLLLANANYIFPQFATHNAYTIAYILEHTNDTIEFEFQRLHGMGVPLYQHITKLYNSRKIPCRVYAPVGGHKELLPYLVRRLLENGANTSFINRIHDKNTPIEKIVNDPEILTRKYNATPHQNICLPRDLYGESRQNAQGYNLFDEDNLRAFSQHLSKLKEEKWNASPTVGDSTSESTGSSIYSPYDHNNIVGYVHKADEKNIESALSYSSKAFTSWHKTSVQERSTALRQCALLLEKHFEDCLVLLITEAGKTITDAIAEVREAIDFCRYYALQAEKLFSQPEIMPGPTGEQNTLYLTGRGTFACISPWNFPLAIFIGQITAALAAGNTVIAKPAGQTPLIAAFAIDLLHQAGIPKAVVQLLPGSGELIGNYLINDQRIKGIAFTGSTETAQHIHQSIAKRQHGIIPLIAETGGQNAMIVDSSALPEQVVLDVIHSAFNSAGQRCSALRVLFLQNDIADKIIQLLKGAMAELTIGSPCSYATDIGPVIDNEAKTKLHDHINKMKGIAKSVFTIDIPSDLQRGSYVAPTVIEINRLSQLEKEVFGPVLHVIRFEKNELSNVISDINNTGYGLTLGVHSRIESTVDQVINHANVGNLYVNRNMIGAVVGVQPFGGEGLSGTGPKAGGPHYLYRFCTERTISTNTAAVGGNTSLLALDNDE